MLRLRWLELFLVLALGTLLPVYSFATHERLQLLIQSADYPDRTLVITANLRGVMAQDIIDLLSKQGADISFLARNHEAFLPGQRDSGHYLVFRKGVNGFKALLPNQFPRPELWTVINSKPSMLPSCQHAYGTDWQSYDFEPGSDNALLIYSKDAFVSSSPVLPVLWGVTLEEKASLGWVMFVGVVEELLPAKQANAAPEVNVQLNVNGMNSHTQSYGEQYFWPSLKSYWSGISSSTQTDIPIDIVSMLGEFYRQLSEPVQDIQEGVAQRRGQRVIAPLLEYRSHLFNNLFPNLTKRELYTTAYLAGIPWSTICENVGHNTEEIQSLLLKLRLRLFRRALWEAGRVDLSRTIPVQEELDRNTYITELDARTAHDLLDEKNDFIGRFRIYSMARQLSSHDLNTLKYMYQDEIGIRRTEELTKNQLLSFGLFEELRRVKMLRVKELKHYNSSLSHIIPTPVELIDDYQRLQAWLHRDRSKVEGSESSAQSGHSLAPLSPSAPFPPAKSLPVPPSAPPPSLSSSLQNLVLVDAGPVIDVQLFPWCGTMEQVRGTKILMDFSSENSAYYAIEFMGRDQLLRIRTQGGAQANPQVEKLFQDWLKEQRIGAPGFIPLVEGEAQVTEKEVGFYICGQYEPLLEYLKGKKISDQLDVLIEAADGLAWLDKRNRGVECLDIRDIWVNHAGHPRNLGWMHVIDADENRHIRLHSDQSINAPGATATVQAFGVLISEVLHQLPATSLDKARQWLGSFQGVSDGHPDHQLNNLAINLMDNPASLDIEAVAYQLRQMKDSHMKSGIQGVPYGSHDAGGYGGGYMPPANPGDLTWQLPSSEYSSGKSEVLPSAPLMSPSVDSSSLASLFVCAVCTDILPRGSVEFRLRDNEDTSGHRYCPGCAESHLKNGFRQKDGTLLEPLTRKVIKHNPGQPAVVALKPSDHLFEELLQSVKLVSQSGSKK